LSNNDALPFDPALLGKKRSFGGKHVSGTFDTVPVVVHRTLDYDIVFLVNNLPSGAFTISDRQTAGMSGFTESPRVHSGLCAAS
jgi:hypothetical protein